MFEQLISGIQLPVSLFSSKIDTLVIVEVHGVPNDHTKQQTRVVKNNGELFYYLEKNLTFFKEKILRKRLCKNNLVRENVCYTSGFCGNLSAEIQFGTSDLNSCFTKVLQF